MAKEQKVHIPTVDEKIKEKFANDFSLMYKKWDDRSYDMIASAASSKTQFAYLPAEMLLYILDIYETVKVERTLFELLVCGRGKEYKRINCEKTPLITEKIKNISLEKGHIASLSEFAVNTLLENGKIDEAIALIKVLFAKDEEYTRRCIMKRISIYIYYISDYKINAEDVLKFISFVESLGNLNKELLRSIKKAKSEVLSAQTRKELTVITNKVFPKVKHKWGDYYSWDDDEVLFKYIDDPIEHYINNNYEQGLVELLNFINKKAEEDFQKELAIKLLIALANSLVNRGCDVRQNKGKIACDLYKKYSVFKEATEKYALLIPKLLSNLFVQSFFSIDKKTLTDVYEKCIVQYNGKSKEEKELLEYISDELKYNHDFYNLVTIDNAFLYWDLSEHIDTIFPKLHFYETSDGEKLLGIKTDIDNYYALTPLRDKLRQKCYWIDTTSLPEILEFDYRYPNGSNGDMIKYILEEHGETEQKSALEWSGKISKEYLDIFEIFAASAEFITSDQRFLRIYDYHVPTILRRKTGEIHSYFLNRLRVVDGIYNSLSAHGLEQKNKRTDFYSKLILEGKTTPKWKSEAQLFALTANLYPDAVYQYRADWLGMQSIDIFIPSLSIGIEYQGIQHYKPIDHFGGEEHFKHQQENDKKKAKLCRANGVHLIAWSYQEPIMEKTLKEQIEKALKKKKK